MSQITFRLRSTTVFRLRVDLRTGGGCRNSTLARAAVVAVFCRYPLTKTDSDRRTDSEIDATSAVGMAQMCPNLGGQPASSGGRLNAGEVLLKKCTLGIHMQGRYADWLAIGSSTRPPYARDDWGDKTPRRQGRRKGGWDVSR